MRRCRIATAGCWVLWCALACACSSLTSPWPCGLHPQSGCGPGEQCIFTNDGANAFTECWPVGHVPPGGDCNSPADCASGETCVAWGLGDVDPSAPNARAKCRRYCTSDDECTPGSQFCLNLPAACMGEPLCGANLHVGICLDTCTPFAAGCEATATCSMLLPDFSARSEFPICRTVGSASLGAACATQVDCGADMFCMGSGDAGAGTCAQICDAGHECPAGTVCKTTAGDPLGACL